MATLGERPPHCHDWADGVDARGCSELLGLMYVSIQDDILEMWRLTEWETTRNIWRYS